MNMYVFEPATDVDLSSDKPILALGWVWARHSENLNTDTTNVRTYIGGNGWHVPPTSYILPLPDVVQIGTLVRREKALNQLMLACGYSEAQILVVPSRMHVPDLEVASRVINIADISNDEILLRRDSSRPSRRSQGDAGRP